MSSDYNERVSLWSLSNIRMSIPTLERLLKDMINRDPERFQRTTEPFVVAEYGCATGFSSIDTLSMIISSVKNVNPELPILIYLNDLPNNHHQIALETVTENLKKALTPQML